MNHHRNGGNLHRRPVFRNLRAFAFDPSFSRKLHTYEINQVTIQLPWEDDLQPGPVDDYLEVVDNDPASGSFYAPVDLNDPYVLAQDGLPPSESDPLFHQQMVYAVARTTIRHFERALGRKVLWSPRPYNEVENEEDRFVEKLRIYPHALRQANAYYSPRKKALLFGYFPASPVQGGELTPGEMVFTCLSHDIIAHETTHALLDGLHGRFIEPSNIDALALHEAFADIVAMFQHFTYPDVLRHQIARTQGRLDAQNLLGQLAYQFGQAIGNRGALRSAIGRFTKDGEWVPEEPDPAKILKTKQPHARGAILVAAVFDAFIMVYNRRIADLLRIASGGTGLLAPGELHPDLIDRLAEEAAKTAKHILRMCIRALDYCPPVDVDFGDYMRALITADADLVTADRYNYRLAIIEAFRNRGIYPRDVPNLSEEGLLWSEPDEQEQAEFIKAFYPSGYDPTSPPKTEEERDDMLNEMRAKMPEIVPEWGMTEDRRAIFENARESQRRIHGLFSEFTEAAKAAYLMLQPTDIAFSRDMDTKVPKFEVHSARPARRVGSDEQMVTELVVEMTQRRWGYMDPERQARVDSGEEDPIPDPDFIFRGGCTLLIDLSTGEVRYCISKDINNEERLKRMRAFLAESQGDRLGATYLGASNLGFFREPGDSADAGWVYREPLAFIHGAAEEEEEEDPDASTSRE